MMGLAEGHPITLRVLGGKWKAGGRLARRGASRLSRSGCGSPSSTRRTAKELPWNTLATNSLTSGQETGVLPSNSPAKAILGRQETPARPRRSATAFGQGLSYSPLEPHRTTRQPAVTRSAAGDLCVARPGHIRADMCSGLLVEIRCSVRALGRVRTARLGREPGVGRTLLGCRGLVSPPCSTGSCRWRGR